MKFVTFSDLRILVLSHILVVRGFYLLPYLEKKLQKKVSFAYCFFIFLSDDSMIIKIGEFQFLLPSFAVNLSYA